MPDVTYDVIVVGARCAGSATARLLAKRGYRTLVVDRASFPSDMPMSTHLLWHAGASQLERWGLLDALKASGCPPLTDVSLNLGAMTLTGRPPSDGVDAAYAPRRKVLDNILLAAAVREGAEVHENFMVDDVVWDNDRVVGIRGERRGESAKTISARLVIGADGRTSKVAHAVNAPTYNEMPAAQGTRFSYFSGVAMSKLEFIPGPGRMVFAWPTNDGLTVVGISWALEHFQKIRDDVEGHFYTELAELAPELAARVQAGKREDAWLGGSIDSFCRKPYGPGWALVGDAGLTLDPITAAGITDAFRDAELLADAVHQGLSGTRDIDEALAEYEQLRNAASLPVYYFTAQMAQLAPPAPEVMQLFGALQHNQEDTNRYFGVFAQTVPVTEFFDPANLARIITSAAVPV
ncbi:MAG: NAD(P)/FAD-dependent oxidoreductase [Phycisphaerae bacterium]|nr:NAD(P)/FAD-dependent oxidoreductase [Gemmatimonadaceae bacterium]